MDYTRRYLSYILAWGTMIAETIYEVIPVMTPLTLFETLDRHRYFAIISQLIPISSPHECR